MSRFIDENVDEHFVCDKCGIDNEFRAFDRYDDCEPGGDICIWCAEEIEKKEGGAG